MTPEQSALENVLADVFREVSTAARLADMAGLDVVQVDRTGSSADVWHSIVGMAIQDGVLGALVDRARTERPRNKELTEAWNAYLAAQPPAPRRMRNPPQGQAGEHLSDYRMDNRIDALQNKVADLSSVVAELKTTLAFVITQNNALSEQNKAILRVLEEREHGSPLPLTIQWYAVGLVVLVLAVFAIVWFGGHV